MTGVSFARALLGLLLVAGTTSEARELRANPDTAPIETVRSALFDGRQTQIDGEIEALRMALDHWRADLRGHPSASDPAPTTDLRLTEALDAFLRLEVDRQAARAAAAMPSSVETAVEVGLRQVEVLARADLVQLARDWCERLLAETADPHLQRWSLKLAVLADDPSAVLAIWRSWEERHAPLTADPFLRLLAARAALAKRDLELTTRLTGDAPAELAAPFAVVAAQVAIARGDLASATARVAPFPTGRPRLLWSQLRLSAGDVAAARSGFAGLLQAGQSQAEAHAGLAWCDLREGRWSEAARHLQQAADLAPEAGIAPAWRLLAARCELRAGGRDLRPIDAATRDLDRHLAALQTERLAPPMWLATGLLAAAPEAIDPGTIGDHWRQMWTRRQRLDAQGLVHERLRMWRDPLRTVDQLAAIAAGLRRLAAELAEAEADFTELRYWTRREVEHRLLPARAWQGGLAERDATMFRDQVRFTVQRFAAQERHLTQMHAQVAKLATTTDALDRHQRLIAEVQAPLLASLTEWPLTTEQQRAETLALEQGLLPAWQQVCDAATRRLHSLKAIAELERIRVEAQP